MRTPSQLMLASMLTILTGVGLQGCATKSGSGAGEERIGTVERIQDQAIRDLPQQGLASPTSRTSPAMRAELAARNATGAARNSLLDVLFDFDQATIRPDAVPVLEANAARLKDEGAKRLLLEGRGDEIGTAAYNIVLGERRARAVRSYLHQLGLNTELRITSYGKDRPLCVEHDSGCMQKNRSVHFVVKE
ncbi:MAG: OmpA family protein [Nitrospira sp.]